MTNNIELQKKNLPQIIVHIQQHVYIECQPVIPIAANGNPLKIFVKINLTHKLSMYKGFERLSLLFSALFLKFKLCFCEQKHFMLSSIFFNPKIKNKMAKKDQQKKQKRR